MTSDPWSDAFRFRSIGVRTQRGWQGWFALSLSVGSGVRVFIVDCDPIGALQAVIVVLQAVAIETIMSEIDILVSSAGNFNISALNHLKKLKNNAFVGNTGNLHDVMDLAGSEGLEGMKVDSITPQKIVSSSPLAAG